MTGQELIDWIIKNHAEDYDIVIDREWGKDYLRAGLDSPDHENKEIII